MCVMPMRQTAAEVTFSSFGYEYQGDAYRSLTEIAKVITPGAKVGQSGFLWAQARAKKGNRMKPPIAHFIYTRKSLEEGLEQSLTRSTPSARPAGGHQSQHHEGWRLIATRYDDGGYSGGNVERPALKQLLMADYGNRVFASS